MPVDRRRYPRNWPKVSRVIRRIAGNCCEQCGIANGAPLPSGRPGRVILTVHHRGAPYADGRQGDPHDKHDIRRENLVALCQKHHLQADLALHMEGAKKTRTRKRREALTLAGQLPLIEEEEEEENATTHD